MKQQDQQIEKPKNPPRKWGCPLHGMPRHDCDGCIETARKNKEQRERRHKGMDPPKCSRHKTPVFGCSDCITAARSWWCGKHTAWVTTSQCVECEEEKAAKLLLRKKHSAGVGG